MPRDRFFTLPCKLHNMLYINLYRHIYIYLGLGLTLTLTIYNIFLSDYLPDLTY